jgi:hypothetical protein
VVVGGVFSGAEGGLAESDRRGAAAGGGFTEAWVGDGSEACDTRTTDFGGLGLDFEGEVLTESVGR